MKRAQTAVALVRLAWMIGMWSKYGHFTRGQYDARWQVKTRTFRRDLETLRQVGYVYDVTMEPGVPDRPYRFVAFRDTPDAA